MVLAATPAQTRSHQHLYEAVSALFGDSVFFLLTIQSCLLCAPTSLGHHNSVNAIICFDYNVSSCNQKCRDHAYLINLGVVVIHFYFLDRLPVPLFNVQRTSILFLCNLHCSTQCLQFGLQLLSLFHLDILLNCRRCTLH